MPVLLVVVVTDEDGVGGLVPDPVGQVVGVLESNHDAVEDLRRVGQVCELIVGPRGAFRGALRSATVAVHSVAIIALLIAILDAVAAAGRHGNKHASSIGNTGRVKALRETIVVCAVGSNIAFNLPRPGTASATAYGGWCAGILVIANHLVWDEETPLVWIASVVRAEIRIVTRQWVRTGAKPIDTGISSSTRITVVAVAGNRGVEATALGIARVDSTLVVVIAGDGDKALAHLLLALVVTGAGVAVVALDTVGDKLTTGLGRTGIVRTCVAIIAKEGASGYARAKVAVVAQSANIAIVTRSAVHEVYTARLRVTRF